MVQVHDYSTKVTIDGVQRQSGHSEIDFVTKQSSGPVQCSYLHSASFLQSLLQACLFPSRLLKYLYLKNSPLSHKCFPWNTSMIFQNICLLLFIYFYISFLWCWGTPRLCACVHGFYHCTTPDLQPPTITWLIYCYLRSLKYQFIKNVL